MPSFFYLIGLVALAIAAFIQKSKPWVIDLPASSYVGLALMLVLLYEISSTREELSKKGE
jgi:hypothetical protein